MNPGLFLREMPSRAPRNGTHDEAILRFRKKKSVVFCLWKNKNRILRAFVLDERRTRRRRVGGETKIAREDTGGAWI